jgi:tetratricopeptide (TPR) repeat protein
MAIYGEDVKALVKKFETAHEIFWKGDYAKAMTEFEIIANSEGLDTSFKDKITSFIKVCQSHLEKDDFQPDNKEQYVLASVVAMNNAEPDQALEMIEKAEELEPESDSVIYLKACAQLANGEKDDAFKSISKAIEMDRVNKIYARNNPIFAEEIKENEAFADLLVDPIEEADMLED